MTALKTHTSPLRITFVIPPPNLSGGVRVVAIYAERLRQLGHIVTVVYPPNEQPTLRERLRSFKNGKGWPVVPRILESHLDQTRVTRLELDRYRPVTPADVPDADVIICTWWETAEWIARFPASKGIPIYFLQHYEVHPWLPIDRVKATWKLPMHKIVVAKWLADIAASEFGDADVSLVPNSVDMEVFHAPVRGKQPHFTVGFMYSEVAFKGCDIALAAIDRVRSTVSELRVMAFGGRPPVAELPLPDFVSYHVTPSQQGIRDIYTSCDAWLFSSRSEGFGLPILEAMACRTPVIGTPEGAAPELIGHGGGILVSREDAATMADAMMRVHRMSDSEWRTMSDAAVETAKRYTWINATALFESALRHAMKKRGSVALEAPA
ncbi:MAG: hypothetical protein AMXMBFR84_24270 [Candidatus Hydrogenedentota bacterium]